MRATSASGSARVCRSQAATAGTCGAGRGTLAAAAPAGACASAAGSAKRSRTSIWSAPTIAARSQPAKQRSRTRPSSAAATLRLGRSILVGRTAGHPTRMRLRHPLEPGEDLVDGHGRLGRSVPGLCPRSAGEAGTWGATKTILKSQACAVRGPGVPAVPGFAGRGDRLRDHSLTGRSRPTNGQVGPQGSRLSKTHASPSSPHSEQSLLDAAAGGAPLAAHAVLVDDVGERLVSELAPVRRLFARLVAPQAPRPAVVALVDAVDVEQAPRAGAGADGARRRRAASALRTAGTSGRGRCSSRASSRTAGGAGLAREQRRLRARSGPRSGRT